MVLHCIQVIFHKNVTLFFQLNQNVRVHFHSILALHVKLFLMEVTTQILIKLTLLKFEKTKNKCLSLNKVTFGHVNFLTNRLFISIF